MHVPAPATAPRGRAPGLRRPAWTHALAGACLLGGLLVTQPARADEYTETSRLIQAGRLSEALQRVERHLADKPRDPQMRFLQGVIHSEAGRQAQAEAVFTRLTQEYPELAEPYNNLAVIQAAKGEWDQARQLLETAVRLDRGYTTAHENLGDIYAQLASRSYSQAQQLDRSRPQLGRKLALMRQLLTLNPPAQLSPATAAPAVAAPAAAAPATPDSATTR